MMNRSLTEEELDSLFMAMKSHSEALAESDSEPEVTECVQIVMALSELLERRKAEMSSKPVAYTSDFYIRKLDKSGACLCWLSRYVKETENSVKLYTTPQPALIIPGKITLEQVSEMTAERGAEYSIRDSIIAAKWWNACCAAMLSPGNSALTTEDARHADHSQETPVRWISISERMPDAGVIVMTADGSCVNAALVERSGANHLSFTSAITGWELPVTHWMPMPAPPHEMPK
ncbi:TPA: DUF551 domain-containing protein [Klebsiella oxytoca]|uniref:DUF551 domain-containing protein n=1 Tax=Klebsiella oxytoca TaxID=571 RepID=UPI002549EEF3|nr:DUF551 domain-containing protein [Klebsiella oxytoca]MEC5505031.1 DUF551 domain-containing protein [Klebsiella oxytoca]HCQ8391324.1 DUF551 domain-containing protein [Klebsiella oxytoca]HCQ8705910.1 DUF551 domain-containing protein [Klebsiella oxytoca]